jgi:hypothetical protein
LEPFGSTLSLLVNRRRGHQKGGHTTGEIEALSLWAGQSVALAKQSQPAAEIVAELVSRL